MKLIVVRHGESVMNSTGLIQGGDTSTKNRLSSIGRKQASKLSSKYLNYHFDMAFTSPLERAKETAEIILKNHPEARLEIIGQLKERDAGVFAGRPAQSMREARKSSGISDGEFKPEGGESWFEAGGRVVEYIQGLVEKYRKTSKNILIVGHGMIFTYVFMWADKFDQTLSNKEIYDHYHPSNTAVTEIEVSEEGEPKIINLNDMGHLK